MPTPKNHGNDGGIRKKRRQRLYTRRRVLLDKRRNGDLFLPRTGQLVKDSGAGLITFRTVGGYFKDPRWAKHSRRGRMRGSVVREYMPEELQRMSVDEINEAIRRDIYINAYEQQKKDPHKYKGARSQRTSKRFFIFAPSVTPWVKHIRTTMSFRVNAAIRCTSTNMDFEGDSLVFDNVLDWDKWQKLC